MRKYDTVVFDLDGTLLDTAEGVLSSVSHAIEKRGLPKIGPDVMRTFIGPPMQKSFMRVFGLDEKGAAAAAEEFRVRYKNEDLLRAVPYDGIFDTISALSDAGVKCAVATYKRQDYAEMILRHFGFADILSVMCGSDPEGKFTKKDIIENAIRLTGITDKSRAVMVGDSDNDAIGAEEIGVDFIGVTYGFGFGSGEDVAEFSNVGCAGEPSGILRYIL